MARHDSVERCMGIGPLAEALAREHHEVDEGIEAFTASLDDGPRNTERLEAAMRALRRHIFLEERFVFPPLRAAGLVAPIFVMLREHGKLWDTMDSLQLELDAHAGDGIVLRRCHELEVQLQHHNSKEEKIVYPEADRGLSPSVTAELTEFVRTGTLPDGWACEKASS